MAAPLVVKLEQVGRDDLELAGGKGANLGELVRAGFPVPDGFVVTTAAYDRFVAHNRLEGSRDQHTFEAGALPDDVMLACRAAYTAIGNAPLAVRSSATAEDLPGAAFAGQQETFLNIEGPENLSEAVKRCWASVWTDRAIAYRDRLGMGSEPVKLAVVVQRLVNADMAGVMFTANPVTGARKEAIIDANPGLGEAVVSGLVTPDHYVLRKTWRGWQIIHHTLGRRELAVRAKPQGGTEHVTGPQQALALRPKALRRLARLGSHIERHFGRPQDIEWATTGNTIWILQARPITALPHARQLPRAVAGLAGELLGVRPYPLDVTAWAPAVLQAIGPMFEALGLAVQPDLIFAEDDGVVIGLTGKAPVRPTPRVLLAPARLVHLSRAYEPTHWDQDPMLQKAIADVRALEAQDLAILSWDQLLQTLRTALKQPLFLAGEVRTRYFPRPALAALGLLLLLRLTGHRQEFGVLLSGAETKTLEANRALEALGARIRDDPVLADLFANHATEDLESALETLPSGKAFLADLAHFLERYGHRESTVATAALPTWRDAPEIVLGVLKGLAQHPPAPTADRPAWPDARDAVLASPWLRIPPLRSAFLGLLHDARYLLPVREDTHFYATMPLPVVRRASLEFGRRLVAVGALDAADDVFHLRLQELERIEGPTWPPAEPLVRELHGIVQRRKARRAALEGTPLIEIPRAAAAETDALLQGTPGSPGLAEGPVRVVHGANEFESLLPGEVLVAPFTNPSWTPLFQLAAAVVADTGGAASHAAIVAREYGIPAVMGTGDATRRLVNGQRVRVDGSRGFVFASEG